MPGNRLRDFRSGDLNEEYGLFMLRLLGAVAPVPRTEDVGIDAFLTLLHQNGQVLSAGRTCMVQLKSNSVTRVTYSSRRTGATGLTELEWLFSLDYPLIIGSVSAGTPLRLYTTNHLLGCFVDHPRVEKITLRFSNRQEPIIERSPNSFDVHLGNPIIEYTLEEARSNEFREASVAILDTWISLLSENISTLAVGMLLGARWITNGTPVAFARHINPREPDQESSDTMLLNAVKALMPLLIERLYHGEEGDLVHLRALLEAIDRDTERFIFDDSHREFLRQNIENLRLFRQAHRATRGGIPLEVADA